jgi:hypothetical protein
LNKDQLLKSVNEKDVENVYRRALMDHFKGASITSPYNTDGLLECDDVKTLLEFKFGKELKDSKDQANIFAQILFYLKRFEEAGEKLPSTLFVGDENECFAFSTKELEKYLNEAIDWKVAPSNAAKLNPLLVQALVNDEDLIPHVFNVHQEDFKDVVNKIKDLSKGLVNLVPINQNNIVEVFRYWKVHILDDKDTTTQEQVNIFIKCLIDREDTYEHPRKANTLVTSVDGRIIETKVKMKLHMSFFEHFQRDHKPSDRKMLVENKDRLVDEIDRRKTGEFFTPTIWAKEAHKMIAENFGENWTEDYVVWDCASGTNNLTRDLKFKELYCSTLNSEDIDTAKKMGFNPEATFFQYDFLNDDEEKLPVNLRKALKEEKVLFLINPPYATSADRGAGSKKDVSLTKLSVNMKKEGFGASSQQLYAQFMYKVYKYSQTNSNIVLTLFTKPLFMNGPSFKKFREKFLSKFSFVEGMLFNASHFSDVSNLWGVSYTIWRSDNISPLREWELKLLDVNGSTFEITEVGTKKFYSTDGLKAANTWVKEKDNKSLELIDVPQLTNPINVKQNGQGRITKTSLGYMNCGGNNIMQNLNMVGIYSSGYANAHGIVIEENNFERICNLFTARRAVVGNWINDKDEYLAPQYQNNKFKKWSNDSIIYSLLQSASYQSSLRNIDYKDKKWDIKNEFFFMSNEEMKSLADTNMFDDMYDDANYNNEERYVNTLLGELELSEDAKEVLEMARSLVRKSMTYRRESHMLRPEYHLNAWDAGWYQIRKGILEHYPELKEELKEFQVKFKTFEARMRKGVFIFMFLKDDIQI